MEPKTVKATTTHKSQVKSSRENNSYQVTAMKTYRKELWFNIPSRRGFVNITSQVKEALRESEVREGLVLVNPNDIPSNQV